MKKGASTDLMSADEAWADPVTRYRSYSLPYSPVQCLLVPERLHRASLAWLALDRAAGDSWLAGQAAAAIPQPEPVCVDLCGCLYAQKTVHEAGGRPAGWNGAGVL